MIGGVGVLPEATSVSRGLTGRGGSADSHGKRRGTSKVEGDRSADEAVGLNLSLGKGEHRPPEAAAGRLSGNAVHQSAQHARLPPR